MPLHPPTQSIKYHPGTPVIRLIIESDDRTHDVSAESLIATHLLSFTEFVPAVILYLLCPSVLSTSGHLECCSSIHRLNDFHIEDVQQRHRQQVFQRQFQEDGVAPQVQTRI